MSAFALAGCARHPAPESPVPVNALTQEIAGVLDVTEKHAAVVASDRTGRVLLVADPPQTALALETMLARTAGALRHLHGRRVRVRGRRQNQILWSAEIIDSQTGVRARERWSIVIPPGAVVDASSSRE